MPDLSMPDYPRAGPDDSEGSSSAWYGEYFTLLQAEAARWPGHEFDEDGWHDEDACRTCLLSRATTSVCRCAECCKRLIIEVSLEDAEREPAIKERGSPIYTPPELTGTGQQELEGYLLNKVTEQGHACVFLDLATNLCTIYETRPLLCRLFDCDGDGREQLIELGILPARG